MVVLDVVKLKQAVWTRVSVDNVGYNTKRIVTDEYQKNLTLKVGKKLLRKNFNTSSKEIKLYSSNAYSIEHSSNTLSSNTVVYS